MEKEKQLRQVQDYLWKLHQLSLEIERKKKCQQ